MRARYEKVEDLERDADNEHPNQESDAGNLHIRGCAGGALQ